MQYFLNPYLIFFLVANLARLTALDSIRARQKYPQRYWELQSLKAARPISSFPMHNNHAIKNKETQTIQPKI